MIRILRTAVWTVIAASLALALAPAPAAAQPENPLRQRTRAEASGWAETSRYEDVVDFMETVAEASPYVHLTHFGYTMEGRALPLAVVGRVDDASPETVRATGRTILYLQVFRIDSTAVAEREFQGHRERRVHGKWETREMDVAPGTVGVPMGQPLARLAFTLLEPRSDDGFAAWNLFDRAIEAGAYPVLRVPPPAR